jgi:NAD-dependent deacetylase
MDNIKQLQQWVQQDKRIVFFGGAGVSTESGIPDFRSTSHGLYHQSNPYHCPTHEILSHRFFLEHPYEFFQFYRTKLLKLEARPNQTHQTLARIEQEKGHLTIITQNADGLHQRAGSKNVLEIHGSIYKNTCMDCGKPYPVEYVAYHDRVPRCSCGGIIRPGIVLFDEIPDLAIIQKASRAISQADLLIIGGTSLVLSSARSLLRPFHGAHLVILNEDPTPLDDQADLVIHQKLGEVFGQISPVAY